MPTHNKQPPVCVEPGVRNLKQYRGVHKGNKIINFHKFTASRAVPSRSDPLQNGFAWRISRTGQDRVPALGWPSIRKLRLWCVVGGKGGFSGGLLMNFLQASWVSQPGLAGNECHARERARLRLFRAPDHGLSHPLFISHEAGGWVRAEARNYSKRALKWSWNSVLSIIITYCGLSI